LRRHLRRQVIESLGVEPLTLPEAGQDAGPDPDAQRSLRLGPPSRRKAIEKTAAILKWKPAHANSGVGAAPFCLAPGLAVALDRKAVGGMVARHSSRARSQKAEAALYWRQKARVSVGLIEISQSTNSPAGGSGMESSRAQRVLSPVAVRT
jgi:hypothetical protein